MRKKICKKCGKELDMDYKNDLCENCSIKKTNKVKKIFKGILSGGAVACSAVIFFVNWGKKGKL